MNIREIIEDIGDYHCFNDWFIDTFDDLIGDDDKIDGWAIIQDKSNQFESEIQSICNSYKDYKECITKINGLNMPYMRSLNKMIDFWERSVCEEIEKDIESVICKILAREDVNLSFCSRNGGFHYAS